MQSLPLLPEALFGNDDREDVDDETDMPAAASKNKPPRTSDPAAPAKKKARKDTPESE